jgi:hypothetical protein
MLPDYYIHPITPHHILIVYRNNSFPCAPPFSVKLRLYSSVPEPINFKLERESGTLDYHLEREV